jgi:hypothetical protein
MDIPWTQEKNALFFLPTSGGSAVRAVRFKTHWLLEDGIPLAMIEPRQARTVSGGTPLITDESDRPIAAVLESPDSVTLALGFDPYEDQPLEKLVWLPILVSRFFDMVWARQGARPTPAFIRAGSDLSLGPAGTIRAESVGTHRFGTLVVHAAVLDERQSMNRGTWKVPASYALEHKTRQKPSPAPLDLPLILASAALLGLSILVDRRRRS